MGSNNPKNNRKVLRALSPKDYATTSPTTTECIKIDTLGFRRAEFSIICGVMTGTSVAAKISESSDNFSSDTAADVTGATFTTLTGASSDDTISSVVVDCSKTERYLQITFGAASSMTVMNMGAVCILSDPLDSIYVGTGSADANVQAVAP